MKDESFMIFNLSRSARLYLRKCATETPALDSGEILIPEMVTQDSGIMTTITEALTLEVNNLSHIGQ